MNPHAAALIKTLKSKGMTLALAESMTCGMAANKLSFVPGISDVLTGSIVCYTPKVKMSTLRIPKKLIETYSCESSEVTEALAKHLSRLIKADVYAAITGLASAGGSETKEKPVGTVFFSVKNGRSIHNHRQRFYGTPLTIHKKACSVLYDFIRSKV
jgi:PncC family amidohydrolase